MSEDKTNLQSGRQGVDFIGDSVFVWSPHICFYERCSVEEWLTGVLEFTL